MGFPFQVSDAELKKKRPQKAEDDDTGEERPEPEQPEAPDTTSSPTPSTPPKKEECPPMPGLGEPDFCGIFEKAMQPFCPQPAMAINININLGGPDPCGGEPPKRAPQTTSFIRGDSNA